MTIINPEPKAKPTITLGRTPFLVALALTILLSLGIGSLVGRSGGSGAQDAAQPQPVKTVTVTETVAAEADGTCASVAAELWDLVATFNADVAVPQNQVIQSLIEYLQYSNYTPADIDALAGTLSTANDAVVSMTDRINVVGPDYQACVG